jgi:DNA-binding XRE family transcriptional regulator
MRGMKVSELRSELGLTLEAFAPLVGLASKGSAHELEKAERASVKVALEVERLSRGRIDAAKLNDDVARSRAPILAGRAA